MSTESVKVVIRVRPLNSNELSRGSVSIIEVDKSINQISIQNPKTSVPKSFAFDAVYDPNSTQQAVYDETAFPLVESVLEGYNGTIFAYGQTGCGKTFTMVGNPSVQELKGIIPNSFSHVFGYIGDSDNTNQFLVNISYSEIYNEEIRDLLNYDPNTKLELREDKDKGIFVKGLSMVNAKSVQEIEQAMEYGNKHRIVKGTNMNEKSSRSHAIFTIRIESSETTDNRTIIKAGKLNLVDLAGSEKQKKTGATGDRLKEAIEINLSLSALGNVISALVDGNVSHVPYRDSKLTRLLQDSLGGNTKTVMIAVVSPADYNYEESLSTLRYASRAKFIQNKPKVNEDPKDALIREYAAEIERLRRLLSQREGPEPVVIEKIVERERIVEKEKIVEIPAKRKKKKSKVESAKREEGGDYYSDDFEESHTRVPDSASISAIREDSKTAENRTANKKEKANHRVGNGKSRTNHNSKQYGENSILESDLSEDTGSLSIKKRSSISKNKPAKAGGLESDSDSESKDLTDSINTTRRNHAHESGDGPIKQPVQRPARNAESEERKSKAGAKSSNKQARETGFKTERRGSEVDEDTDIQSRSTRSITKPRTKSHIDTDESISKSQIALKTIKEDLREGKPSESKLNLNPKLSKFSSAASTTKSNKDITFKSDVQETNAEELSYPSDFEEESCRNIPDPIQSDSEESSSAPKPKELLKPTKSSAKPESSHKSTSNLSFPAKSDSKLHKELKKKEISLQNERIERERLEKLVQEMNKKIITGGESSDNTEKARLKAQREYRLKLKQQKKREQQLVEENLKKEEEMLMQFRNYKNLQEEVEEQRKVIEKLRLKYKSGLQEIEDLNKEHEFDRETLLEAIRSKERDTEFYVHIVHQLLAPTEINKIRGRSKYDFDNHRWKIPAFTVSNKQTLFPKLPAAQIKELVSADINARKIELKDESLYKDEPNEDLRFANFETWKEDSSKFTYEEMPRLDSSLKQDREIRPPTTGNRPRAPNAKIKNAMLQPINSNVLTGKGQLAAVGILEKEKELPYQQIFSPQPKKPLLQPLGLIQR